MVSHGKFSSLLEKLSEIDLSNMNGEKASGQGELLTRIVVLITPGVHIANTSEKIPVFLFT